MRVVIYNILDGGAERCDALAAVIERQQPDVVCLVEAEDARVLESLANRMHMDFIQAPGNRHASALLSRWTIRESINHALLLPQSISTSFLEASVVDPTGAVWTFGVVHLIAHSTEEYERLREAELDVILGTFENHRSSGRPHLLLGDFNSNAPTQQIDPARCKPATQKEWAENGGYLPRRAVQKILDAGYVDATRAVLGSKADTLGTFTTDYPSQRVDYVFAHGLAPAQLKAAWVIDDAAAKDASDHFPIGVDVGAGALSL